jgi:hypothetical protein
MRNYIMLLTFLLFLNSVNGQREIDLKKLVGFACFSSGSKSESVIKFTKLIQKEKYKTMFKLLDSENVAEQYLATIVLERLAKNGKVSLNDIEKLKIGKIKSSEAIIEVCSGCTYFEKIPVKQLFIESRDNFMKKYAEDWLDRQFQNNSKNP